MESNSQVSSDAVVQIKTYMIHEVGHLRRLHGSGVAVVSFRAHFGCEESILARSMVHLKLRVIVGINVLTPLPR